MIGTGDWMMLIFGVVAIVGALMGILFAGLKSAINRLETRINETFNRMDDKVERSNDKCARDVAEVRVQVQDAIKMLAIERRDKA